MGPAINEICRENEGKTSRKRGDTEGLKSRKLSLMRNGRLIGKKKGGGLTGYREGMEGFRHRRNSH